MELKGSRYYYSLLNENDKKVYEEIYRAILSRKTRASFRGLVLDNKNLGSIITSVNFDNPQFYFVNFNKCFASFSFFGASIEIVYYYDNTKIDEIDKQITETVKQILNTEINEHQSDYDKVLRLHDKLKFMAVYDDVAAKDVLYRNIGSREANTIVGMFISHKCVCEGYAKAMQLLCTMTGIESILVYGTAQSNIASGSHVWNMVKINGYYHHVDVTWDSQYAKGMTLSCYGYLNLSDSTIEKDHTWEHSKYPKCDDEPYNYFKMNSAIISSKTELERFLKENFTSEEDHISFKVKENSSLKDLDMQQLGTIIQSVVLKCKYVAIDRFEMSIMENQNVYAIQVYKSFK